MKWSGDTGFAECPVGQFKLQMGRDYKRARSYFWIVTTTKFGPVLAQGHGLRSATRARSAAVSALRAVLAEASSLLAPEGTP